MKQQMNAGKQAAEVQVDVRLSVMKETSDKWFEGLYDHLRSSCHNYQWLQESRYCRCY